MKFTDKEVIADEGKYLARKGSNSYFTRCTKLKGDNPSDFVEVDYIPSEQKDSIGYNEEVNNLIRQKYSLSEELAILRQRDIKPTDFEEYNNYAENCKAKAKLIR